MRQTWQRCAWAANVVFSHHQTTATKMLLWSIVLPWQSTFGSTTAAATATTSFVITTTLPPLWIYRPKISRWLITVADPLCRHHLRHPTHRHPHLRHPCRRLQRRMTSISRRRILDLCRRRRRRSLLIVACQLGSAISAQSFIATWTTLPSQRMSPRTQEPHHLHRRPLRHRLQRSCSRLSSMRWRLSLTHWRLLSPLAYVPASFATRRIRSAVWPSTTCPSRSSVRRIFFKYVYSTCTTVH